MQKIVIGKIGNNTEAVYTEQKVNLWLKDGWKIADVRLTSFQPRNGDEDNKAIFVLEKDDELDTN